MRTVALNAARLSSAVAVAALFTVGLLAAPGMGVAPAEPASAIGALDVSTHKRLDFHLGDAARFARRVADRRREVSNFMPGSLPVTGGEFAEVLAAIGAVLAMRGAGLLLLRRIRARRPTL